MSSAPLPAFSFEHAATRWWWSLRRLSCLGPLLALCVLLVARRWIAPWWHDDAWLEHFAFLVWAPLAALVLLREPLVDAERVVSRLNLGTFAAALAFALVSATPLETWWIRPVSIRVVWLSLGALATLVPLRREVARAWARAGRGPRAALALLLVAGALVSGTEFAAWWRLSTVPPTTVAIYRLGWGAYSLNVALLLAAGAVVWALGRRASWAALAMLALSLGLHAINYTKLRYLRVPLVASDAQHVSDMTRVVGAQAWILAALILLVAGALCWLLERPHELSRRARGGALLAALLLAATCSSAYKVAPLREAFAWLNVFSHSFSQRVSTLRNGLLLELVLEAGLLEVEAPQGYDAESVRAALAPLTSATSAPAGSQRPHVIVWLMEAVSDPLALGFELSADPLPTFHALQRAQGRGEVLSPVFGGLSANAEFELITGCSMAFLPRDSCPFKQFIHRPLPTALPALLAEEGYRTRALHVESLDFFNYRQVYPRLGYQRHRTLWSDPWAARDPSGRRPSDRALARAVIDALQDGEGPAFVFAFPNGTHWPWSEELSKRHEIEVLTELPAHQRGKLRDYVNSLREMDEALRLLVEHARASPEPVLILALGDHLPVLDSVTYAAVGMKVTYGWRAGGYQVDEQPQAEAVRRCFTVPAVLWSNRPRAPRDFSLSMNHLPALLLEELGLRPPAHHAQLRAIRERVPLLGRVVAGPGLPTTLLPLAPSELAGPIRDARLLQYDLLFGERYSLQGQ
ncbi:MAG TPA: hypothetical protein DEA08_04895 [Planctomycetes bacterium]|nr:hypothetical protein [Planctomycetota bacterium]